MLQSELSKDGWPLTIRLNQAAYIAGVLARFGMQACNPVSLFVESFKLVTFDPLDPEAVHAKQRAAQAARRSLYQAIIDSIVWSAVSTRPI